jgi:streptogramin lyase
LALSVLAAQGKPHRQQGRASDTYGMVRSIRSALVGVTLGVIVALGLSPSESTARTMGRSLRLPGRSISVATPSFSPGPTRGRRRAGVEVTLASVGHRSLVVTRSDFTLSVAGDMFGTQGWNAGRSRVTIAPGHSRTFRLAFRAPDAVVDRATLFYRPAHGGVSGALPLNRATGLANRPNSPSAPERLLINTLPLTKGVGDPWGTAIDSSGNVWFAEPGCDFAPTCGAGTPPGQLGKIDPSSGAVTFYTLPSIPGNQPIFVAFDGAGNLWFTTPNNSMIGEFSPSTGGFVGQWPVTAGSGPWDLIVANGQIWYTEHLASAVGAFNPDTHAHQDFQTPSANSNPYGITANGGLIWFTENNSSVDRVAVLDTTKNNVISEYPIVRPLSGTPHMIDVDRSGRPWWTEGFSNTIATLNPVGATPGSCGTTAGTCTGIRRFEVPPSITCGRSAHTSGIAFQRSADLVWLDNSLTAQIGSFTPATGTFAMNTLSDCNAHPHDGLSLDSVGNVWFDEEFANAIGELVPDSGSVTSNSVDAGATSNSVDAGATSNPASSAPPAEVSLLAPANTERPMIVGGPTQAQTLTATKGSWTNDPTGFGYQWQRCEPGCSNITDAAGSSYTLAVDDVGANVRVVVTASNTRGSAQAASGEFGPVGPSVEGVKAAIADLLHARRGSAIAKLLKSGGYRVKFEAPSAGSLTISWYVLRKRAHKPRRTVVASARLHFSKAGPTKVTIRLTSIGKRLLRRATKLRVTAKVTFVPEGEAAVTSVKRFGLRTGGRVAATSRLR